MTDEIPRLEKRSVTRRARSMARSVVERLPHGQTSRSLAPYAVPGLGTAVETAEPAIERAYRPIGLRALADRYPPDDMQQHQLCPVCGDDRVRMLFHPRRGRRDGSIRWHYAAGRCATCRLLRRVPSIRPHRVPDLYTGGDYSAFLEGSYGRGRRRNYERTFQAWGEVLSAGRGRRLLDFGCGAGIFLEMAIESGYDAFGIDLAPDAVEIARDRVGSERAWAGDVDDVAEVAAGGFDVITLWSVLAHFADPVERLTQLRSLLAPDGILVIYTVNAGSTELKLYRDGWNGFTKNHLFFWEPSTLPSLLRLAGFEGVAFRSFYPTEVELGRLDDDPTTRDRIISTIDRHGSGNMMRAIAINGDSGTSGIPGALRL